MLFRTIFAALPVGQEMIEAITALVAVAMLFYVSFWLIARLEHKRWLEFVKARMWSAVSVGSAASLMIVGFTAVYREGFETALFYQALISFGTGLGIYILAGLFLGLAALAVVAWLMFRLGRRLPIKTFMNVAVVLVMATSVAFLGNAVHALQAADRVPFTPLAGWPRPPIFLSEATGYWPTVQTVTAQLVLTAVYVMGGVYVFLVEAPARSPGRGTSTRSRRPPRPPDLTDGSPRRSRRRRHVHEGRGRRPRSRHRGRVGVADDARCRRRRRRGRGAVRRRGGAEGRRGPDRDGHALDDPGGERAARR